MRQPGLTPKEEQGLKEVNRTCTRLAFTAQGLCHLGSYLLDATIAQNIVSMVWPSTLALRNPSLATSPTKQNLYL